MKTDRLLAAELSTFFFTGSKDLAYRHFHWKDKAYKRGGPLSELGIDFDEVDAACVNPLDWGLVWLFRKDEVMDYRVSGELKGPVGRARINDDKSVSSAHRVKIADHPIFGALPSEFHSDLLSVVIAPVSMGAWFQSLVCAFKPGRGASFWLHSLRRASATEAVDFRPANEPSVQSVINGLGQGYSNGFVVFTEKSVRFVNESNSVSDVSPELVSAWSVHPRASVPVALEPLVKQVRAQPNGQTLVDLSSDRPPETLVAIKGRRGDELAAGSAWIAGVTAKYPCLYDNATKTVPVGQRTDRMKEFLTQVVRKRNIPDFLRTFVAVTREGAVPDVQFSVTFYVAPDFMAVGSDSDYVRIPLCAVGAQWVADQLGCALSTGYMTLRCYLKARHQLVYQGLDGTELVSSEYIQRHHAGITAKINAIRDGDDCAGGMLLSGHSKEIVIGTQMHEASRYVLFWGGVYRYDRDGNASGGNDRSMVGVAHPEPKGGKNAEYVGKKPGYVMRSVENLNLKLYDPAHENTHDEYAQLTRLAASKVRIAMTSKKSPEKGVEVQWVSYFDLLTTSAKVANVPRAVLVAAKGLLSMENHPNEASCRYPAPHPAKMFDPPA